jgi:hypothetical protein
MILRPFEEPPAAAGRAAKLFATTLVFAMLVG